MDHVESSLGQGAENILSQPLRVLAKIKSVSVMVTCQAGYQNNEADRCKGH